MDEIDKTAMMLFFENKDDILEMLGKRYPVTKIWKVLVGRGKYHGDYSHLCKLIKSEFTDEELSNEAAKNPSTKNKKKKRSGPKIYLNDIS